MATSGNKNRGVIIRSWPLLISGIVGAILVGALLFQIFVAPTVRRNEPAKRFDLAVKLPRSLQEWQTKDLPLGESELLQNETAEILRFDEYVFREYSRGAQKFSVYAAYWSPGKMPIRLVELHTPDRCWTENGWTCLEMKFGVKADATETELLPAQWRVFAPPGGQGRQYVFFWLLNGGRLYDFGRRLNTIPNPVRWWEDVLYEARQGSLEHIFVRITSDRPFEELRGDAGWEEILRALASMGLGEEKA